MGEIVDNSGDGASEADETTATDQGAVEDSVTEKSQSDSSGGTAADKDDGVLLGGDGIFDEDAGDESDDKKSDKSDEKSDDEKSEGDKADDEKSDDEGYADFEFPEGTIVNETLLSGATAMFREDGLSQERAQEYVTMYATEINNERAAAEIALQEQADEQAANWKKAVQTDPDIGGENLKKNLGISALGVKSVGTPELAQVLKDSGLGNHPAIVKAFYKVGLMFAEDEPGAGGQNTGDSVGQKDIVERMYPNASKNLK